jgi:hypothetical protein
MAGWTPCATLAGGSSGRWVAAIRLWRWQSARAKRVIFPIARKEWVSLYPLSRCLFSHWALLFAFDRGHEIVQVFLFAGTDLQALGDKTSEPGRFGEDSQVMWLVGNQAFDSKATVFVGVRRIIREIDAMELAFAPRAGRRH